MKLDDTMKLMETLIREKLLSAQRKSRDLSNETWSFYKVEWPSYTAKYDKLRGVVPHSINYISRCSLTSVHKSTISHITAKNMLRFIFKWNFLVNEMKLTLMLYFLELCLFHIVWTFGHLVYLPKVAMFIMFAYLHINMTALTTKITFVIHVIHTIHGTHSDILLVDEALFLCAYKFRGEKIILSKYSEQTVQKHPAFLTPGCVNACLKPLFWLQVYIHFFVTPIKSCLEMNITYWIYISISLRSLRDTCSMFFF